MYWQLYFLHMQGYHYKENNSFAFLSYDITLCVLTDSYTGKLIQKCQCTAYIHTHTVCTKTYNCGLSIIHLCPFETKKCLNHSVMSYFTSTSAKHHSIHSVQFRLRDMKAAFTPSRSVKDGTQQTQEINPQWQSAIHHFHHFSCEKKKE